MESARVLQARERILAEQVGWEELPRINQTGMKEGFLQCKAVSVDLDETDLLVEIPHNIAAVMAGQPELALEWRMRTRPLFQSYFSRGYTIVDFHQTQDRAFYQLSREAAR